MHELCFKYKHVHSSPQYTDPPGAEGRLHTRTRMSTATKEVITTRPTRTPVTPPISGPEVSMRWEEIDADVRMVT